MERFLLRYPPSADFGRLRTVKVVTQIIPRGSDIFIPDRGASVLSDWFDLQNSQNVFDQSSPSRIMRVGRGI